MRDPTVEELVEQYREAVAEHSSMSTIDPQKANRAHDRLHQIYKILRQSPAGRQAIAALLDDPNPEVRCWAAAHSLEWSPLRARRVLEELSKRDDLIGFEALMILQEFDAGRLSFDY
jgi:DNA-directed RNA polymerase subunit F